MAVDARKRQKKLAKQKAKKSAQRRQIARHKSQGLRAQFEKASAAPIMDCRVSDRIWECGIGNVLVSRQLTDGSVACALLLVDMYCLGVKDVFAGFYPLSEYKNKILQKMIDEGSEEITPPEARCLVVGAVEFARDCGFEPHPDYRKARGIFGDVDPSECSTEFTYGRDGMPVYIAGPYDSPQRQYQIISMLRTRCGDDGYESTMKLDVLDLGTLLDTAEVSGDEDAGYLEFDDDSAG